MKVSTKTDSSSSTRVGGMRKYCSGVIRFQFVMVYRERVTKYIDVIEHGDA